MKPLSLVLALLTLWLAAVVGIAAYDAAVKARVQHQQHIEGGERE